MPNYRRPKIAGSTYFITQVTDQRQPWLCQALARHALRTAHSNAPYCLITQSVSVAV